MNTRNLRRLDTVLHHTLDWYINRTLPGWGWLQVQENRVCQALEERFDCA